jgi:acyl-CoA thioester hydrolase
MAEAEEHIPGTRDEYAYSVDFATRWGDNDMLGHLNNVVYHRCYEDVVTRFTRFELGVDWLKDDVYPVAIESQCRFHSELSWPETVTAALRIARVGRSSVVYHVALFGQQSDRAAASGRFVHVYVGRATKRPVDIPAHLLERLKPYLTA